MFMSKKHFVWAGAGLILTLIVGSPAVADDVELLISTPGASNAAKPNILFIIDSSGSMTTVESSQEPYDPNSAYSGPCESDRYYWNTSSSIPSCKNEYENEYQFDKDAFVCAQGITQARASGSYTDTMAMYRQNNKGRWKWRTLSRKQKSKAVECKADSGLHGYGANAVTEPYAQAGTNRPAYTSDPNLEVDWGSRPTHQIITVYDSNYLNWFHNPPGTSMSRTKIVKAVTKNVLGSVNNVNVGFMRFNYEQGGPVIHGIKDLDSNRVAADNVVDNIPASGWTPLSETMYEAARYWRGMPAYYGGSSSTDNDALISSDPMIYKHPAEYACAKNFVVLLTDGEPTRDTDAYYKVPALPDFAAATGRGTCTGSNNSGACLDDIAHYLQNTDINPLVPGDQNVTTYTIGFTVDLPILKDTATLGGGEYYLASDVKSLTAALTDIVTNIFDRDISFTAPAVAVNAYNRTQNLNDLYVSVFRATDEMRWPGNMKKYSIKEGEIRDANDNHAIDPNTGFFDDNAKNIWSDQPQPDGANVLQAGAASRLPAPEIRRVFTNISMGDLATAGNLLHPGNSGAFQLSDLGLKGVAGEPSKADLIDWARGVDVKDEDNDPSTTVRKRMGDSLHSQPAAVVYGDANGTIDTVVFTATNDGYLHALNGESGEEKWAFIPHELLPNLADLYYNENVDFKNYGIDGDVIPVVYDQNEDGVIDLTTDFVYVVFGMRRGGDNVYLVDVSDPNRPSLKWMKSYQEFGQTWSSPSVAKIDVNSSLQKSPQKAVLVMGAGYDTAHDAPAHPTAPDVEGAGIFMLDLETGEPIWRAGRDSGADLTASRMTRAIPTAVRVIDMSGDGFADRMYASDMGGQVWRFDITNGKSPDKLVAGGVIAQFGAEGLGSPSAADTRRFYATPDVAMFKDKKQNRHYLAVNIGSGYRAHPLDNSAADRFYSYRDSNVFNHLTQAEYDGYRIATDDDMAEVSGQIGTVIPAGGDGWKLTLPATEKVLSTARTFDDTVYFVSFEARTNSSDPCQAGLSLNRLYRVKVDNGDPPFELESSVPLDEETINEARVSRLEQGGIAPQPVFLFPAHWDPDNCKGEECRPRPVACIGVECFDPNFTNQPVRTLWTQDGIQ